MTIDELEDRHLAIWDDFDGTFDSSSGEHTGLSIQFTIEVLESMLSDTNDLYPNEFDLFFNDRINYKIKELKQYLDEKV